MNTAVNFKIAKLLKGAGFNDPCGGLYIDGELETELREKVSYHKTISSRYYIAPTIAEVVMWLYEKHGIWIHAMMSFKEFTPYVQCDWNYRQDSVKGVLEFMEKRFNSPTEAYEEAIEYTLKNIL